MIKKPTIAIMIIGAVFSLLIYVPKINASAIVFDFVTELNTGITGVSTTSVAVKEYALDTIARGIARSFLNEAISGVIDSIQGGGRDGGPAFVQNWRNFQTDAQYRGENVFRDILAGTKLCDHFSQDIKNLFNANQKIPSSGQNLRVNNFDPFPLRANCTLPSNFSLDNFKKDFSGNGGWEAFSRLLEPQNNIYGTLFSSLGEANRQRVLEESGDVNEASAGSGYTSVRDSCAGKGAGAKCVFLGKVFTPGDLLGKSAAITIDQDLGWLVSSDELSEVIIGLVSALTNRMKNLATSNTPKDYAEAPLINDGTAGYLACINSCPKSDGIACQNSCAKTWGFSPSEASSTPPPRPEGEDIRTECVSDGSSGEGGLSCRTEL